MQSFPQANHQLLSSVVTFMIEHAEGLFVLPKKLLLDVEVFAPSYSSLPCLPHIPLPQTYISRRDAIPLTPRVRNMSGDSNSPVVSTIFSFVDRLKTQVTCLT